MATDVAVRASRLFFALGLAASIGAMALLLLDPEYGRGIKCATGTGGIIIVVTQTPLIGAMPRAFMENTFGTLMGASLGILMFVFWDRVVPFEYETDYYLRLMTTPLVGAVGLALGSSLGMEGAGKLVPMTYLLVIVNNTEEEVAVSYGLFRMLGIVVGMLCSHLTSVIIFQRSASEDVLDKMRGTLGELCELNRLVWAPDSLAIQGAEKERLMEISISKINMGLNTALSTLPLTQCEVRVSGHVPPHWWFLPWALTTCCGWRLSTVTMTKAVSAVRRVSRLQGSFWLLLSHPPADISFLENPAVITLLKDLRFLTQAVLDGVLAAYTGLGWVDVDALAYLNSKILEAQAIRFSHPAHPPGLELPRAARKLEVQAPTPAPAPSKNGSVTPPVPSPAPALGPGPGSEEALSEPLLPLIISTESTPSHMSMGRRGELHSVFHVMPAQEMPAELLAMPRGTMSAEVWWNTFQFLLVQLAVETRALHHSVCDLINAIHPLPCDTMMGGRRIKATNWAAVS